MELVRLLETPLPRPQPGTRLPAETTRVAASMVPTHPLLCAHTGRAGVPMEVMGLMLGEFVDDYTVRVVDVFAMPQSGTGVSVEAVDPVFQTKMLDMLKQVGRCVDASTCWALCWVTGALVGDAAHWPLRMYESG